MSYLFIVGNFIKLLCVLYLLVWALCGWAKQYCRATTTMPAGHLSVSRWVFSFIQLPYDMKQGFDPCSTSACKSELGYKNHDDFINSRSSNDTFHAFSYLLSMVSRAMPCQKMFKRTGSRLWLLKIFFRHSSQTIINDHIL